MQVGQSTVNSIAVGLVWLAITAWYPVAAADDIVGYTTAKNSWHLGDKLEVADPEEHGFAAVPSPFENTECYADLARTIQFSGEDALVSVSLLYMRERLCGIIIFVPEAERSYSSLKKYYRQRYAAPESSDFESISWLDDDGDMLHVSRSVDSNGEDSTAIVYMSEQLFDTITGDSIPQWLKELMKTQRTDNA